MTGRSTAAPCRLTWPLALLSVAMLTCVLVACSEGGAPDATATDVPGADGAARTPEPIEGDITVFAASSLTDAFQAAATRFEQIHPAAHVRFNFAASSALATQINEGGPADLFASADAAQMKVVVDAGNASDPKQFASNLPVVIVPGERGGRVRTFADLAAPGVLLVLAAPEVPIGRYARDILANASKPGGIAADFAGRALSNLRSNEANVRAVLAKIQLGEADAGIVYATDAATAPEDVRIIDIPAGYNVVAQYPMAVITRAHNPAGARAWVDFILSPEGQEVLASHGFGKPTAS